MRNVYQRRLDSALQIERSLMRGFQWMIRMDPSSLVFSLSQVDEIDVLVIEMRRS